MDNFSSKRLFRDEHFHRGFQVIACRHGRGGVDVKKGDFPFPDAEGEPIWMYEQWHSRHCVWRKNFKNAGPYTLANSSKCVSLDPETDILTMRLNGMREYDGKPHISKKTFWPHLLLEQIIEKDFSNFSKEDAPYYSADADKIVLELDIRIADFKDTPVKQGICACQYMAYFYLALKEGSGFIYFGVNLFDSRGAMNTYWKMDVMGEAMIYLLSTSDSFGGDIKNSFNAESEPPASTNWKRIVLDLTPHINRVVDLVNSDMVFGRKISRSDLFVKGTNIGFEVHGNYDCTVQIRDYNLVSHVAEKQR